MPTIREVMNWDSMPPQELEEKRRGFLSLVKERQEMKVKGTLPPDLASEEPPLYMEELHNWLEITRQLRKRNSGPAKAPKKPKGAPVTSADLF